MTNTELELMKIAGLTEADFKKQPTAQEIAEDAYLLAEYNNILIEMMMEE